MNNLIFVGEKKQHNDIAEIYREAIFALPELLTTDNDQYCFGAPAFRKWADDIESGYFERIKPDMTLVFSTNVPPIFGTTTAQMISKRSEAASI